jgi:hypothetical protein
LYEQTSLVAAIVKQNTKKSHFIDPHTAEEPNGVDGCSESSKTLDQFLKITSFRTWICTNTGASVEKHQKNPVDDSYFN